MSLRRIAGVIDQDFLGDEEDAAGGLEPLDVERAVVLAELHQVDARQVAGRVVEEHVLAARIAGVDAAAVRAGVPVVDRRVVLHAGIAAVPRTVGHAVEHVAGLVGRAGLAWGRSPSGWSTRSSFSTACMNSSVTRTERFAFWNMIEL